MTIMGNNSMTIAELAELLDVYGSERTRWPAEARAAAAQLLTAEPAARRLLAEAEALDRVLDRAPTPGARLETDLADRIVAAAQRSPRIVRLPTAQRVAEVPAAGGAARETAARTSTSMRPAAGRNGSRGPLSRRMGAAGVLAASLMVGVLIGSASNLPLQLLPALADMAGFTDRDDLVRIALSEEVML